MCTASHNPKAYTGAKLVARARSRCRGDSGIGTSASHRGGLRRAHAGRRHQSRRSTSTRSSRPPRCGSSTAARGQAAEGRRRRRQRHGRADGRAAARASRPRPDRDLLDAGRQLPRPRAQPAAAREPRVHHRPRCVEPGRRPGHRLGRRRRPLLLHRRHRRVRGRRLPDGAAGRVAARARARAQAILYDVRASRAVADTVDRGRRHARSSTASATRSSRPGCARRARCSAARSPGTTTSATSTARTRARSRRC